MGLSLGEYTALCFAGAFSFDDGVRLTRARGLAMQHASLQRPGGMVGLSGVSVVQAQQLCQQVTANTGEDLWIGNFLSDNKFALSGTQCALEGALQLVATGVVGQSASAIPLAVAGAFHTDMMAPARQALHEALQNIHISTPAIPVLSNVDSCQHSDAPDIASKLLAQLTTPVQWSATMQKIVTDPSFQCAYEIGPGRVCAGILKSVNRRAKVVNIPA